MGELAALGVFFDCLRELAPANGGAPLVVGERRRLGLVTVMVRAGQIERLAERTKALFGLELPQGPSFAAAGGVAFAGVGPGVWLAMRDEAPLDWAIGLADDLAGIASLSDQSSGYAVLRISGSAARDLLSRGAFIDFDPAIFGPGTIAVTEIAHIGTIIRQTDDMPGFEIAMFRSLAGSFWHWLVATAAAMGIRPTHDPALLQ